MSKVWKVPVSFASSLPIQNLTKPETRRERLYSLYLKTGKSRYQRVSSMAYPVKTAARVFQDRLLSNPLQFSIRPIKEAESVAFDSIAAERLEF